MFGIVNHSNSEMELNTVDLISKIFKKKHSEIFLNSNIEKHLRENFHCHLKCIYIYMNKKDT